MLPITVGGALALGALAWWRRRTRKQRTPGRSSQEEGARLLESGVDVVPLALLQATGSRLEEGNRVEWCDNRRIFTRLEEEVRAARHSVHVGLYIWKPGPPGERFARVVAQRAREGLSVRVLVDPVGSEGFEEKLAPLLRASGAQVHFFRPVARAPLKVWGRNHRKLVVVDGRVGFTGGFGVASEWTGEGGMPEAWRDANVRVEGPVVLQMQQAFAAHWLETGGQLLPSEEFARARPAGTSRAAFITSTDVKGHANAFWVTHFSLAAAREQLWIANAYFVPPPEVLALLRQRCRAGVDVRVLVPGPHTDQRLVRLLQRRTYRALLHAGVRIWEYQPSMIHAKTMLVDGRMVVVGSTNLDPLSLHVLEEGSLVVDDVQVAAELQRTWEKDLARAVERHLGERPTRGPASRLVEAAVRLRERGALPFEPATRAW